jgi:hypothetical protein
LCRRRAPNGARIGSVSHPVADAGRDDRDVFTDDTSQDVKPRAVAVQSIAAGKGLAARSSSQGPFGVPEETKFRFTPFKGPSPRGVRSRSISDQAKWQRLSPRGIYTFAPS